MKYLVLAWALAALVLFSDARAVRDYLALTSSLGLRGQAEAPTPLTQAYPGFAADAQTWVRHSLSLLEGNGPRLRYTTIDNAPFGREVHWNSAWAWTIAGAGAAYGAATGVPIARAVEKATVWVTPIALLAFVVIFSAWALRRIGLPAAIFLVAAMTMHERFVEGFFPGYVDHHGLLTAAVLGLVLGAMVMVRGERSGAVFSALCGAFGMWVSAASVLPAIAATAAAGAWVARREPVDARLWRLWGAIGAAASLLAYLAEYFPQHMGLRLEVNHPLYAIAWLAAGELIARSREERMRTPADRVWPGFALAALPATILAGGVNVLSFTDPFMARLHAEHIEEFLPIWRALRTATPELALRSVLVEAIPLAAAIATLAAMRRRAPPALVFATLVAVALTAMAWWQVRWQLNASAAGICLALVVAWTWTGNRAPRARWIAVSLAALLYVPGAYVRYHTPAAALAERSVNPREAGFALARDVARALRESQPHGNIVLLATPNDSTNVGYYGRFATLGTLYWENAEGLKAAAAIFSARDDAEAERLARARGVTHIALVSEEGLLAAYHGLLHPGATQEEMRASFGWRLLAGQVAPWLQRIPYERPPDLRALDDDVLLFSVK